MSLHPPANTDRPDVGRRAAGRRARLGSSLVLAALESHRAAIAVDLSAADAERILERLRAELGLD